jgi:MEMO1 family protein
MNTVRRPAVAGMFYPDNPAVLDQMVADLLAHPEGARLARAPKALIVPHAGYAYSGPVAASAYAQLEALRGRIRRVVLLGPAHHVHVRGLALPKADRFATPLGELQLDRAGMQLLSELPQVTVSAAAHAREHSLEVQLPFLQQVLGDFELLPLVVGEATAAEVADVLDMVWGGDETLIVVSSDLSHYLPDDAARKVDGKTVAAIMTLDSDIDHDHACGATPINGLMLAAQRHGLRAVKLDVRNSSQTAGDAERVVGYASFAFLADADPDPFDADRGATLLKLARSAIGTALGHEMPRLTEPDWLAESGATFVTLTIQGELRGCIGSVEASRPLGEDVRENAMAAAFHDPRFLPLQRAEFDDIRIEVSLLSPTEPMTVTDEASARAALRPHVDGVVLEYGRHRSTFLPQVWEQLPDPADFLAHLKRKAGLSKTFWADGMRISRYTVTKWQEDTT